MTDTDDRYEKILKSFEADTEFDVPKVDKKREASTEDWMDDVIPLDELLRARTEDEAGVVAKPYGADSLAIEDHDIISMNDLLKLQKEEQGIVAKKFNGGNGSREAHGLFSDPDNQDSDFQWHKADSSDLLKTNQPVMNPDGSISDYNWDASLVSQDRIGRADKMYRDESSEYEEIPTVEQQQAQKMREEIRNLASYSLPEEYAYDSLASEAEETCISCGGSGEQDVWGKNNEFMYTEVCERCGGKGTVEESLANESLDYEHMTKWWDNVSDNDRRSILGYGSDALVHYDFLDFTDAEDQETIISAYRAATGESLANEDDDQKYLDGVIEDWAMKDLDKESLTKIDTDDKDDTEKVYDELIEESYEESTMENQNQGFKSDSDEYGVADLNADREGKNMSKDFWSKTITTDDEATVLQEYNPQPNAKMGDYNVEVERELGAKDFPDSVTEVKKNDRFLASELFDQTWSEELEHWVMNVFQPTDNYDLEYLKREGRNAGITDSDQAWKDFWDDWGVQDQMGMNESKASEDFIHNYVDSSDIDVNDDGSLGDLDKQFEDEELPDEYYEMKNHNKLNAGDSKASEFTPLELYETIEPLWNNLSENDRKKIIINTTNGFVGQDNNIKSNWDQIDHMTQQRIADNWDNAFNMIDEDKKTIYGLESLATEDDFNHEFDELSSLAQQKIEDTDVTPTQWDETPIPQREQLEDAIADAPVKKLDEQYDSMGDVWQCPECGFKTGFEDEFNDHEKSHVKAFSEDDISRPYDDLLDQFRS